MNGNSEAALQFWNNEAATFDREPDHGLLSPDVLQAWTEQLGIWIPVAGVSILDVGCGTGSLSLVLAKVGHTITGIDFSPAMIAQAEAKVKSAGCQATFAVMDAADPQFPPHSFDVVLGRHILWALPDPSQVLKRWMELLKPGGRLVLIEGYWNTGAGLHTAQITDMLPAENFAHIVVHDLMRQPVLWGKAITDERYAVVALLPMNA